MQNTERDLLYECFERVLQVTGPGDHAEVLVVRVAEEYLMELVRQAHIPIRYLDGLREDICTEVQDMLRIKTYGYMSLAEYLEKCRQPLRKATS